MIKTCPILKSECLEHKCEFYIHLIGLNPQTGAQEDRWGCAVSYLPLLLIENANVSRQGNASMDKMATEINKMKDTPIQIYLPDKRANALEVEFNGNANGENHA